MKGRVGLSPDASCPSLLVARVPRAMCRAWGRRSRPMGDPALPECRPSKSSAANRPELTGLDGKEVRFVAVHHPSRWGPGVEASGEVEDEHFAVFDRTEFERFGVADGCSVALLEALGAELDDAFGHLDPCVTFGGDGVRDLCAAFEECVVDARILLDGDGLVLAVGARDESESSGSLVGREMALLVARGEALLARLDPDLDESCFVGLGGVELGVRDAAAGGHGLDVAGSDGGRVLVGGG